MDPIVYPLGCFPNARGFTIGQPNQWILCFCCGWNWFGPVTGKKFSYPGTSSYQWESEWKHVERSTHRGVCGESLENCANSGMSIFSWIVAKLDSRVLVGSSKVETVMGNCFLSTSIVWVRAIYITFGRRDVQRCLGNKRLREELLCEWEAQKQFCCESCQRSIRKSRDLPSLLRSSNLKLVWDARNMGSPRDWAKDCCLWQLLMRHRMCLFWDLSSSCHCSRNTGTPPSTSYS